MAMIRKLRVGRAVAGLGGSASAAASLSTGDGFLSANGELKRGTEVRPDGWDIRQFGPKTRSAEASSPKV